MSVATLLTLEKSKRLLQLDALRGFVMVIMALDHTRSFLCESNGGFEIWMGQFPQYAGDTLAFFTRFITHLAPPGFFFLMGAGMIYFVSSRKEKGWKTSQILLYFVSRGVMLIVFQFLIENQAWAIGMPEFPLYVGVLFALGSSMILGAGLVHVSKTFLVIIGLALIILTEALLPEVTQYVQYPIPLRLLLLPGFTKGVFVLYPFIPWLGVTALGMAYAKFLKEYKGNFQVLHFSAGAILLVLFFVLRSLEGFGNIRMSGAEGVIGFFNVVKYPPSITLLLFAMGVNMIVLGTMDLIRKNWETGLRPLLILGRTPLFFYLVHLYLYAFMGKALGPEKLSVSSMYIFWFIGVLIMLLLCVFYDKIRYKLTHQFAGNKNDEVSVKEH